MTTTIRRNSYLTNVRAMANVATGEEEEMEGLDDTALFGEHRQSLTERDMDEK